MKRQHGADDAYTGTTIILLTLAILISLVMYSLFIPTGFASGATARAGMARITDLLVLNGDVTGYADLSGTLGIVRVNNPVPSPDKLGAVRVPVKLGLCPPWMGGGDRGKSRQGNRPLHRPGRHGNPCRLFRPGPSEIIMGNNPEREHASRADRQWQRPARTE